MNDFEEGKIGFTVKFSITLQNHKGEYFGFNAKETDSITFDGSRTFKTKKEAIDAVVMQLCNLRDKDFKPPCRA